MKKLYFLAPIVLTAIFCIFWWGEKKTITAADKQRQEERMAKEEANKKRDLELRKKAFEEANANALKRIKEGEERRKKQEEQAAEVETYQNKRDLAYRERERQLKQVTKLQEDLRDAKDQLTKAQEQVRLQKVQLDYLTSTAGEVTQTKSVYEQALTKMDAAERAAAEAARAAAAAQKRS